MGEGLVSGMVTPDRYVVNKETLNLEQKEIADQPFRINVYGSKRSIPGYLRKQQKLSGINIRKLAMLVKEIESSLWDASRY